MGVSPMACKCIAGGANPEYSHGGEGWLVWSRLVSCTHTDTESWAGCWFSSQAPVGVGWRREQVRIQVAGISEFGYMWGESW